MQQFSGMQHKFSADMQPSEFQNRHTNAPKFPYQHAIYLFKIAQNASTPANRLKCPWHFICKQIVANCNRNVCGFFIQFGEINCCYRHHKYFGTQLNIANAIANDKQKCVWWECMVMSS